MWYSVINWLKEPSSTELAKYVDCYWFIEKPVNATSFEFPKLNPDPAIHVIVSPEKQAYHYDLNPGSAEGLGSHCLFAHQQTYTLDHSQPFVHLGIKLRIGAAYSVGGLSDVQANLDTIKTLQHSKLFQNETVTAEILIRQARGNIPLCIQSLDTLLLPWLKNCHEDQHSKLTRKALSLLNNTPISEIGSLLHCAQRTLERSFIKVTGMTLKQCQSMNKLDALLEFLYQRENVDIDWVEVAQMFGFSDQPHLIRQLKKQIGLTPKAYVNERGLTIDVYGGVQASKTK